MKKVLMVSICIYSIYILSILNLFLHLIQIVTIFSFSNVTITIYVSQKYDIHCHCG